MTPQELIERSHGHFFTVRFIKLDGTERVLTGRTGVTRYLHGGQRTTDPAQYAIVYDVYAKGYRAVAYDRVLEIRMEGKSFTFETAA